MKKLGFAVVMVACAMVACGSRDAAGHGDDSTPVEKPADAGTTLSQDATAEAEPGDGGCPVDPFTGAAWESCYPCTDAADSAVCCTCN